MFACVGQDIFAVQPSGNTHRAQLIGRLPFECSAFTFVSSELAYLVRYDDTFRVWSWKWLSSESPVCAVQVPHAICKMILHRGKVFAFSLTESCFFTIDPLCQVVEEFQTGLLIRNMVPVGDSFILEANTVSCDLYLCTLASTQHPMRLEQCGNILGLHKQKAYIRSCHDSLGVNDTEYGIREKLYTLNDMGVRSDEVEMCLKDTHSTFLSLEERVVSSDQVREALCGSVCALSGIVSTDCFLMSARPASQEDDCCTLCFCEFDEGMSAVVLDCGHRFHGDCLDQWVRAWNEFALKGEHIRFTRAYCPSGCKHLVRHPAVPQSQSIQKTYSSVENALRPVLDQCGDPAKTAYDFLTYICHHCGEAFYGGERVCSRMMNSEPPNNPEDLVCEKCSRDYLCPLHGRDFLLRSCRYCCNPATHRSFGTRYMCDRCNVRWSGVAEPSFVPCLGSDKCPLRAQHITSASGILGCMLCLPQDTLDYTHINSAPDIISPPQ